MLLLKVSRNFSTHAEDLQVRAVNSSHHAAVQRRADGLVNGSSVPLVHSVPDIPPPSLHPQCPPWSPLLSHHWLYLLLGTPQFLWFRPLTFHLLPFPQMVQPLFHSPHHLLFPLSLILLHQFSSLPQQQHPQLKWPFPTVYHIIYTFSSILLKTLGNFKSLWFIFF